MTPPSGSEGDWKNRGAVSVNIPDPTAGPLDQCLVGYSFRLSAVLSVSENGELRFKPVARGKKRTDLVTIHFP